ncbi:hypothetical protein B0H14DRAFT_2622319 [Mycena olivaceomarginata]|nr:hypothetical protein B0H14DRAFT_2622319 [Mycena olivaceomarginata]
MDARVPRVVLGRLLEPKTSQAGRRSHSVCTCHHMVLPRRQHESPKFPIFRSSGDTEVGLEQHPGDSPLSNEEGCTGTTEGWDNPPLKVLQDLSTDGSLHSDRTGRKVRPLEIEGLAAETLPSGTHQARPQNLVSGNLPLSGKPVQEGILEGRRLEGRNTRNTGSSGPENSGIRKLSGRGNTSGKSFQSRKAKGGAAETSGSGKPSEICPVVHTKQMPEGFGESPPQRSNGTERRNRKCPGFQMKTSESSAARPWKRVRRTVPALHRKVNDKVSNNEKIPGLPPGGVVE